MGGGQDLDYNMRLIESVIVFIGGQTDNGA